MTQSTLMWSECGRRVRFCPVPGVYDRLCDVEDERGSGGDRLNGRKRGVTMYGDGRGLRLWFRDEIENALLGVFAAMSAASGSEDANYRRGFLDALRSVALVFGVRVGDPEHTGTLRGL
jgi:hypothetical protein